MAEAVTVEVLTQLRSRVPGASMSCRVDGVKGTSSWVYIDSKMAALYAVPEFRLASRQAGAAALAFRRDGLALSYGYDDYGPAYKLGYEGRSKYAGRSFDQAESDLAADWERSKGNSRLAWNDAKQATRAAWHRVERAIPGDADGDGR